MKTREFKSSALNLIAKVAGAICGLASSILIARMLGPESFGQYSYLVALIGVLVVPAQAGLPTLLVREIGKASHRNSDSEHGTIWRWATGVVGTLSVVLVALFVLCLLIVPRPSLQMSAILLALPLIPLTAHSSIRSAALRGIGRVNTGQVPELLIRPGVLLLAAVLFAVSFDGQPSAAIAMLWNLASVAAAFIVGLALFRRYYPQLDSPSPSPDRARGRSWLRASVVLGIVTSIQVLNSSIDVLMIGAFLESGDVGVYRAAVNVTAYTLFGMTSITAVILPRIIALIEEGDQAALRQYVKGATRTMFAVTLFGVVLLVAFGRFIFGDLFGDGYSDAYAVALVLAVGPAVLSFIGPVSMMLNMIGQEIWSAIGAGAALVGNVCLNLLLIPHYGITGAAIATVSATVIWSIFMLVVLVRKKAVRTSAL